MTAYHFEISLRHVQFITGDTGFINITLGFTEINLWQPRLPGNIKISYFVESGNSEFKSRKYHAQPWRLRWCTCSKFIKNVMMQPYGWPMDCLWYIYLTWILSFRFYALYISSMSSRTLLYTNVLANNSTGIRRVKHTIDYNHALGLSCNKLKDANAWVIHSEISYRSRCQSGS